MTIYNLEYSILDSIGRAQRPVHKGVYSTIEDIEFAKQDAIKEVGSNVKFNIYPIENLFEKISLS